MDSKAEFLEIRTKNNIAEMLDIEEQYPAAYNYEFDVLVDRRVYTFYVTCIEKMQDVFMGDDDGLWHLAGSMQRKWWRLRPRVGLSKAKHGKSISNPKVQLCTVTRINGVIQVRSDF